MGILNTARIAEGDSEGAGHWWDIRPVFAASITPFHGCKYLRRLQVLAATISMLIAALNLVVGFMLLLLVWFFLRAGYSIGRIIAVLFAPLKLKEIR